MSFTNEQLHAALLQLRADVEAGTIPQIFCGICTNVRYLLNQIAPFDQLGEGNWYLWELCNEWPEFSGNSFFPVPCADYDPEVAYKDMRYTLSKWSGEYGAARLRLLDYLIEQTKPQTP